MTDAQLEKKLHDERTAASAIATYIRAQVEGLPIDSALRGFALQQAACWGRIAGRRHLRAQAADDAVAA